MKAASRRMQRKNSEIVRRALREFLGAPERPAGRPADRVRHLIGSLESGCRRWRRTIARTSPSRCAVAGELLLDTGALVSRLDRSQTHHRAHVEFFDGWHDPVVSTEAVVTEASHLLGQVSGGRHAVVDFFLVRGRSAGAREPSLPEALPRPDEAVRRPANGLRRRLAGRARGGTGHQPGVHHRPPGLRGLPDLGAASLRDSPGVRPATGPASPAASISRQREPATQPVVDGVELARVALADLLRDGATRHADDLVEHHL